MIKITSFLQLAALQCPVHAKCENANYHKREVLCKWHEAESGEV